MVLIEHVERALCASRGRVGRQLGLRLRANLRLRRRLAEELLAADETVVVLVGDLMRQ